MHYLHRAHAGLHPSPSMSVPGQGDICAGDAGAVPQRQCGHPQAMPEAAGPDGLCHSSYTTGPPVYEGRPALGGLSGSGPSPRRSSPGEDFLRVRAGSASVEEPRFPNTGCHRGNHPGQEGGHHRRVSGGLGRYTRGEISKWGMEPSHAFHPHKLSGAAGCSPGTETFPPMAEDKQFDCCGLYQQTRGSEVPPVTCDGSQADSLEQCAPAVAERTGDFIPKW